MIHGNLRDRLADAVGYVGRRVDDVFRRIALEKVLASTIEGRGGRETGQNIEVALKRKGVSAFRDSRGREWSLKNYAEMVARTTASEAASMGTLNRLAENGVDLVRIVVAADACDVCKEHKDKVYSISGSHPRYPRLEEVPPYHPRCACRVAGYIEGLSDKFDSDEARRKATKVILPDGKTAGRPGGRKGNWTRSGGLDASREMFEALRPLGRPYENPDYGGVEQIEIPGLGVVGFRPVSIYGKQEPTIDVNATIEGVEVNKIKFED